MKTLIIFLTLIIISSTNAYSKEVTDCAKVKKYSMKAAMCKIKSVGKAADKKIKGDKKSGKKSFLKKFGEAKSLSDLTK